MLNLLQPSPNWLHPKRWLIEAYIGVLVCLILFFRQPNWLEVYSLMQKLCISGFYGLVCTISLCCARKLGIRILSRFKDIEFSIFNALIFNILSTGFNIFIVGVTTYLTSVLLKQIAWDMSVFILFEFQVFALGFLQLFFFDMLLQWIYNVKHNEQAQVLNNKLKALPPDLVFNSVSPRGNVQELWIESDDSCFKLILDKGICIQIIDNYNIRVQYWEHQCVKNIVLRTNLKLLNRKLKNIPNYCRCDMNYWVNTNKIVAVFGDTQGYQLELSGINHFIPATYTDEIAKRGNIYKQIKLMLLW